MLSLCSLRIKLPFGEKYHSVGLEVSQAERLSLDNELALLGTFQSFADEPVVMYVKTPILEGALVP
jgi:hypothetical protein